jgi:hypothetical protein
MGFRRSEMSEPQHEHTTAGTFAGAKPVRDLYVSLGLGIAAISAAFSSFDGLRSLALASHWSKYMAPLFALCIDAYALAAIRVWLTRSTSPRASRFARRNAVGAVVLSLIGNASYHLIAAEIIAVNWILVLGVGAVPPVILGLVTHLSVLRKQDDVPVRTIASHPHVAVQPASVPVRSLGRPQLIDMDGPGNGTPAVPKTTPRSARRRVATVKARRLTEDELFAAAQQADMNYRQQYGRGITRDALRSTLKVGGDRATALLRQLRSEAAGPTR